MRLNWNNIGKGLEAIAGAKKARDLAQESERYNVTEGAYGQGLSENLQQVISARDQALQTLGEQASPEERQRVLDQYTPAMSELSRRVGLEAPDYSVASGAQNFATRQEARQAAAPLRAEGLAGVYRRYGDVEKADALETRAYEQQRALAAEGRAAAGELRAGQEFSTRQTLTGLQIEDATRTQAARARMDDFNSWRSKNPTADFTAINTKVQELGMGVEEQFKVASNLTGIREQAFKASAQRIEELVKNQGLDGLLKAHKESNDLDPNSHFEIIRGKGGALSLNRVNTTTGEVIQPNVFSGNEAETVKYLNTAAVSPATIIDYTLNLEKTKLGMRKDEAAIRASDAQTRDAGKSSIEKNLATLGRLGIEVSPEDVRAMAGIKQEKLSPEAAARLEAITASVKGNDSPKALAEAQLAITELFKGEALKQRNTTIVRGLKTANSKNDLPAAIKQLQDAGVGDETIVGLAKQAGVTLPPSFVPAAPAAAPAAPAAAPVSPRTGLSSGRQQYGPLTPRSLIEADARAGNPNAIAYLRQQEQNAVDLERARTENAMRAAQGL